MAGRKKLPAIDMPPERDQKIKRWLDVVEQLRPLQDEEAVLRMSLVKECFNATKLEGTASVDIGFGYRLKATKVINYMATNENGEVQALLNVVGPVRPDIVNEIFKWKPELRIKAYREVIDLCEQHPEIKIALARVITAKPGMPQLEFIKPERPAE